MDGFDSGDKGVEAEGEGTTTPLPARVSVVLYVCLGKEKYLQVSF